MDLGASGTEGLGQGVQRLEAYFYADDGILALALATRLQRAFDTLTELFGRVGLHTNVVKTVIMDCKTCLAIGGPYAEAYGIRMMGEGQTYRYRLRQRVYCPDCEADLVAGSLASHRQAQHGVDQWGLKEPHPPHPMDEVRNYRISFSRAARNIACPVGGCTGRATIRSAL